MKEWRVAMFSNMLRGASSDDSILVPLPNPFGATPKIFLEAVYIRQLLPSEVASSEVSSFIGESIDDTTNMFGIFDHEGDLIAAAISRSEAVEGAIEGDFKPQAWLV